VEHHCVLAVHLMEENGTMADGLLQALAIVLNVLRDIPYMDSQIHAVPRGARYASAPIGHQRLNTGWRWPVGPQEMG
jgi:hypothetical protein